MLSKGFIVEKTFANSIKKYVVIKTENPATKKHSTINTDFSPEHWTTPMLTLLANVKALGDGLFEKIFNEVLLKMRSWRGHSIAVTKYVNDDEGLLQSKSDSSDNDEAILTSDAGKVGEPI